MDILTAQIIFFAIMTVCVCVWCHSLVRALQLGRDDEGENDQFGKSVNDRVVGSAVVRGEQEVVSRAVAKAILQHGTTFEITERTTDRVFAKRTPATQSAPAGTDFSEMGFATQRSGEDSVDIIYCIDFGERRRWYRKIALGIIFGVGLPSILGVGLLIWLYVIPNGMPGMRWQVLQTLHIAHALWPPFMFIHRHTATVAHSRAFVANLLTSVSLTDGVEPVPTAERS